MVRHESSLENDEWRWVILFYWYENTLPYGSNVFSLSIWNHTVALVKLTRAAIIRFQMLKDAPFHIGQIRYCFPLTTNGFIWKEFDLFILNRKAAGSFWRYSHFNVKPGIPSSFPASWAEDRYPYDSLKHGWGFFLERVQNRFQRFLGWVGVLIDPLWVIWWLTQYD